MAIRRISNIAGDAQLAVRFFDFSVDMMAYPVRPGVPTVFWYGPDGIDPAGAQDKDQITEFPAIVPPVVTASLSGKNVTLQWTCEETAPTAFEIFRRLQGAGTWGNPIHVFEVAPAVPFEWEDITTAYSTNYDYGIRTAKGSWLRSELDIEAVEIGSEDALELAIIAAGATRWHKLDEDALATGMAEALSGTDTGTWSGAATQMQAAPLIGDGGYSIDNYTGSKRGIAEIAQQNLNAKKWAAMWWQKNPWTDNGDRAAFSFWSSTQGSVTIKVLNWTSTGSAPYNRPRVVYADNLGNNKIAVTVSGYDWSGETIRFIYFDFDGANGNWRLFINDLQTPVDSGTALGVTPEDVIDRYTLFRDRGGTATSLGAIYDNFIMWPGVDTLPTQQQLQNIVNAAQ